MAKKNRIQKEIVKIVQNFKKQGKKTVTISGSFDILHSGHIKCLKEAEGKGDILIVLLNSDESVRMYKGEERPINSQKDRAEMLSAIEYVDFITIFNEINPLKILEKIKPDIHCQGKDWGENCVERKIVEKYGGKIHVLQWQEGFSTTDLIEKDSEIESTPAPKAVFLDRDGTINVNDPTYLHKIEDFKFTPNAIEALKKLSQSDYKIIVITNQSGIGRGYFKEEDLKKLYRWMLQELKKKGIRIDKIYYCPHLPKDNCSCRKPKPGMIFKAVGKFGINLSQSWIIGDDDRDIMLGREVNAKTIKLGEKMPERLKLEPNYYADNLLEAVNIILK
jgi:D-glycero-D-manno-heptose 1,7-bisphosphate phosphatase